MITYALTVRRSQIATWIFLIAGLLLVSMSALGDEGGTEQRVSATTELTRAERDQGLAGRKAEREYSQLLTSGPRVRPSQAAQGSQPGQLQANSANLDFWFFTADVVLFNDHDRDGYYHGIDLLFDADTVFTFAEVYAVVYLSLDGGPWNEYAATENFTLFGASSDDEYVIVTELLSGYPTGSYDILIELFDAHDDTFLAFYGPEDTSELAFLPLEDADRDLAEPPDVIIVKEGGGSAGLLFILILALAAVRRSLRARCA